MKEQAGKGQLFERSQERGKEIQEVQARNEKLTKDLSWSTMRSHDQGR